MGSKMGIIFRSILGSILGFNIGFNIGFNVGFQYWVSTIKSGGHR